MNERIKKLMRQACKESIRPESVLEDVPQDVLEKFAELIVRECAQEFDNTYMRGGKTMGAYIREKFGVEQ